MPQVHTWLAEGMPEWSTGKDVRARRKYRSREAHTQTHCAISSTAALGSHSRSCSPGQGGAAWMQGNLCPSRLIVRNRPEISEKTSSLIPRYKTPRRRFPAACLHVAAVLPKDCLGHRRFLLPAGRLVVGNPQVRQMQSLRCTGGFSVAAAKMVCREQSAHLPLRLESSIPPFDFEAPGSTATLLLSQESAGRPIGPV